MHISNYVYVSILRSSTYSYFQVNLEIIVPRPDKSSQDACTSFSRRFGLLLPVTNSDVKLQNSNLKFGVMPISYTLSNFREKQHINEQYPAKQVYKI